MEKTCTLLVHFDKGTPALANEIKEALEGNDIPAKVEAMKKAVMLLLNGETIPQLFITIVRYVLPSEDHTIQKLLLLYLEIIDKTDSKGKVLPEMILICQNLRNNLQHPNEYLRGVTLRFLCRLNESEIIEPLIPSVLSNLEHRHPFVRRNAILAVMAIYKLPQGEQLLIDAPETIEKVLSTEQDPSAKRNAFLMLFTSDQDRAVNYLFTHIDRILDWGEQLQMVVLELIRKVCRTNKAEKGKYIKVIISLLTAPSAAVVYDCAGTLVSLSSAPTAIRAAANTYCQLLLSQSDNNVKLIILDRLNELKSLHREIMVEMIMDVLRALSSPNLDIRKKTLDIALELITPRNVDEVVLLLKKEVMKTQNAELEKNGEYRQMLVQAIHACAIKFPEVASTVVHVLMDFLGDTNVASAMDVVVFVREIIETNPKLRVSIITRLLDTFYQIRAARVCSCALWIIGEYCLSLSEVESGIATIKQCLGDLPFYTPTEEGEGSEAPKPTQPMSNVTTASSRRPVVLADGTYATQSAALETAMSPPTLVQGSLASQGNLRSLLLSGDFFLGAVIACTLTKLVLRLEEVQPSKTEVNRATTQTLLILVSMLQLGQSSFLPHPIDNDSYDRIVLCMRLLSNTGDETRKIWLQSCRQSFVKMLADKQVPETEERKAKAQVSHAEPDDLDFYHLKSRKGMSQLELEDKVQDDLKRATGEFTKDNDDAKKLNRILQLTGFSDPVYAEAYVTVHDYDIVLDVTVINRTKETLQNLCLELATLGDLKLVEHPQTLAPESSKQIRANIKVSSTETRVIVQNIVYEISNVMERNVFALNNIHIDMMDYISPATCADTAFRTMCAEFESENKGSTPLNFLYPDATEPPTIRVGFVFPGEHSPGGGHNVIWGLHEALKSHNHNNVLLGFICATEGLSAQKTLEITGDILSTYKNHRGYELCRSTKDQISITEQVNAALAACKALKLDGLVVVGGVTANTDAAQLKKTFVADKRRTMVAGVPVNFNGDVKVNFVETNVGVDTICKYYCYFIRLVDLKESQFALESALRSQPNTVILDEELDLDASKLTIPHLANQICEEVQAWAEQDKYHGVIRLPEGLIKRMLPSVHALPQSTREKLLARLVEKEIEKREKAGTYKGKKFNAICHFFGYQAPGSLPSESDCDDANVCGCQAQLLGHICYDLLATELKVYDESQKLSNAEKIHKGNRNERRREQHKMEKEVERAAKKKEEPKSQIEGRARSETIRSQMEELGVKVLPKLPKEKQPKPKKKKEINMNRNVVL